MGHGSMLVASPPWPAGLQWVMEWSASLAGAPIPGPNIIILVFCLPTHLEGITSSCALPIGRGGLVEVSEGQLGCMVVRVDM